MTRTKGEKQEMEIEMETRERPLAAPGRGPAGGRLERAEAFLRAILNLGRDRDAVPPHLYDEIVAFLREPSADA